MSIEVEAPFFFWIRDASTTDIGALITDMLRSCAGSCVESLVGLAAFLGKRHHASVTRGLGTRVKRLNPRFLTYPADPADFFGKRMVDSRLGHSKDQTAARKALAKRLQEIADRAARRDDRPPVMDRHEALAIDCFLYARTDRYPAAASSKNVDQSL